jgi:hypothetical protein
MTQEPEKQPNSSPEKKFVQRSLAAIARWSPLGGTSYAFGAFLLKQEWVMALALFPVTAIAGVWAAYSKSFTEQLVEIYNERAKSDAKSFVVGLDNLNQSLKEAIEWQFAGFDEKYLKQQVKPFTQYVTEGYNPDKTAIPMLEEVFVPLELSGEMSKANLQIWDLLRRSRKEPRFRQMVIRKRGGFGKTTLLRHIALIYGQGKHRKFNAPKLIPFLIFLRDWKQDQGILSQDSIPNLPELITNFHLPKISKKNQLLKPPPKWAESLLNHGDALVMLDGFDELPESDRRKVSYWISEQMQEYDQSVFILTSRPAGYEDYVANRPATPLTIQDFSPVQQADFVNRWYLCQERCFHDRDRYAQQQAKNAAESKTQDLIEQLQDPKRPELQELAKNPLLLNMLTTFHRFDVGLELPRRKVELYKNICKLQLEDRPRARGIKMLLPFEKSQFILQRIAMGLLKGERLSIQQSNLLNFLGKQSVFTQEDVAPKDFLKQIETVSELLVQRDLGEYEFPHLSFQGYFAASYLEQMGDQSYAMILENWDKSDAWRETILFYTAQLPPKQFTEMLEQVCKLGVDSAKLAYECLRQYRNPEKIDQGWNSRLMALKVDVKALLYQSLEEHLKYQRWYAADQETCKLILKVSDREENGWLREEDIKAFPCEELLAIDRLWIKHSNGLYGFSIQKDIYVECGGKLDFSYPSDETWDKFCDRTAWKSEGELVIYPQPFFEKKLMCMKGHLPRALKIQKNTWYQVTYCEDESAIPNNSWAELLDAEVVEIKGDKYLDSEVIKEEEKIKSNEKSENDRTDWSGLLVGDTDDWSGLLEDTIISFDNPAMLVCLSSKLANCKA